MHKSFFIGTGIVTESSLEVVTNVKMPLMKIILYSPEDNSWNSEVNVVITLDKDIKKSQAIGFGDIVLFTGIFSSLDGLGDIIYAINFLILEKNKDDQSIEYCKLSALDYLQIDNFALVEGKVLAVNDESIKVMAERSISVKGELKKHDIVAIYPLENISSISVGDDIICNGSIANNRIVCTTAKINEA